MVEAKKNESLGTFRDVVEAHQRGLYRLAYRLTGNHHDAEDLSQEVFIKVHAALPSFRGDSEITTWIHRIAVNTYLNKRRKKALSFMRLKSDFDLKMSATDEPVDRDAENSAIRKQVERAKGRLSPKERVALTLRFDNDYSIAEVAKTMKVAEGTVKSLLYRAVQKMRKHLAFLETERF